jgi:hypothetical protein
MIVTGETEQLSGKPVPVPLSPPQIPLGLTRGERSATNRLSHSTARSTGLIQYYMTRRPYPCVQRVLYDTKSETLSQGVWNLSSHISDVLNAARRIHIKSYRTISSLRSFPCTSTPTVNNNSYHRMITASQYV